MSYFTWIHSNGSRWVSVIYGPILTLFICALWLDVEAQGSMGNTLLFTYLIYAVLWHSQQWELLKRAETLMLLPGFIQNWQRADLIVRWSMFALVGFGLWAASNNGLVVMAIAFMGVQLALWFFYQATDSALRHWFKMALVFLSLVLAYVGAQQVATFDHLHWLPVVVLLSINVLLSWLLWRAQHHGKHAELWVKQFAGPQLEPLLTTGQPAISSWAYRLFGIQIFLQSEWKLVFWLPLIAAVTLPLMMADDPVLQWVLLSFIWCLPSQLQLITALPRARLDLLQLWPKFSGGQTGLVQRWCWAQHRLLLTMIILSACLIYLSAHWFDQPLMPASYWLLSALVAWVILPLSSALRSRVWGILTSLFLFVAPFIAFVGVHVIATQQPTIVWLAAGLALLLWAGLIPLSFRRLTWELRN